MSRIVVCDTGPLIHLAEANILYLLRLAGEIMIPSVVADEFKRNTDEVKLEDWIIVKKLEEPYEIKARDWRKQIDIGESAAIALAMQMQAEWLLTDDTIARQFGETLGLEIHGSIGLLLWAVAAGHVENENEAYHLVDLLVNSSLWISDRVVNQTRKAIRKLYST